jgi:FdrA protein
MVYRYREVKGRYVDSVLLMLISRDLEKAKGVSKAGMVTASKENLDVLRDIGFDPPAGVKSTSIIVAVEADTAQNADKAIKQGIEKMDSEMTAGAPATSYTLDTFPSAVKGGDLPIVFISTPGQYVKDIALHGLDAGCHLHIFSSNVSLEQEKEIKLKAKEKGLLVMGPDAGTTIIDGKGIGFSNAVRKGDVGVVGSSGTGIQELTCLLDKGGLGVSAAIGVGSKDLTKEIDGTVTKMALDMLRDSKLLIVIAKKPDPAVRKEVVKRLSSKPSVFISLGDNESSTKGEALVTGYIDDGVNYALTQLGKKPLTIQEAKSKVKLGDRTLVRGLFVGGSICYQAQAILARNGLEVFSNAPVDAEHSLPKDWSKVNVCIDTGAEEYVVGRPHPMIDPKARNAMIVKESARDDVAVILFDITLGWGSSMTPLDGLEGVKKGPVLVCSIVGTEKDKQGYDKVKAACQELGAVVLESSGQAAQFAAQLVGGAK